MYDCLKFKAVHEYNISASGTVGGNIAKLKPTIMFFVHKDLSYGIEMDLLNRKVLLSGALSLLCGRHSPDAPSKLVYLF